MRHTGLYVVKININVGGEVNIKWQKRIKIKVSTETDVNDVEDLKELLENIQDTNINVSVDTESTEVGGCESRIEELEQKRAIFIWVLISQ